MKVSLLLSISAFALPTTLATPSGDGHCEKGSKLSVKVPQLETTLGKYNDETLDAVDKVVDKLARKGIKAIISPHDANSLPGDYRKDVYADKWSKTLFYSSPDAFKAYDKRIGSELPAQADDIDKAGIPSLYWQFLPRKNGGCDYDPRNNSGDKFAIFVEGGTDIASVMNKAASADAAQDWSSIMG
ncbi:hypothetical protein AAE478_003209 [Parahypoxylon ruwenzoriense]